MVWLFSGGRAGARRGLATGGLDEGDALVCGDGSEIYQRGYRTEDPYWKGQVGKGWEGSKVVKWAAERFWGEQVAFLGNEEEMSVRVRMREGVNCKDRFREEMESKLEGIGVKVRVERGEGREVVVRPRGGSVVEAVKFIRSMLRVKEGRTRVFGKGKLVEQLVRADNEMVGVVIDREWRGANREGRVYVTKEEGTAGSVEGILHHAVL